MQNGITNRADAETWSFSELTGSVPGAGIEIHRQLGSKPLIDFNAPGLKTGKKRLVNLFKTPRFRGETNFG
jgi:hypothetical protein